MARKTPTRTCVACGRSADKRELLRVVRTPEGDVVCDETGRLPGRGAYLCRDLACLEKAISGRILEPRLRTKVTAEQYGQLRDRFRDLVQASAQVQSRDGE